MEQVLSPADDRARRRMSALGLALIVLAFVGPVLASVLGISPVGAFQAGEDMVRTFGSLLFLSLISWLVTRKRSPMAQAKGRLVVGLLLCITVGTNIARAQGETEDAKRFVREALQFRDEQAAHFTNLAQRFDKVDLSTVLTPQGVATPAGIATGRAVLAQYKALLSERDLLLKTYLSRYERFINERAPSGAARAGAMSSMNENMQATAKLYRGLGEAQRGLVTSMERIIDWGEAQKSRLGVQDGQLLFATREQQAELQALLAKVNEAEKAVNAQVSSADAAQRRAQTQMQDQNQRAAEFLRK